MASKIMPEQIKSLLYTCNFNFKLISIPLWLNFLIKNKINNPDSLSNKWANYTMWLRYKFHDFYYINK